MYRRRKTKRNEIGQCKLLLFSLLAKNNLFEDFSLKSIIGTITFCGENNLALRGHRDDGFKEQKNEDGELELEGGGGIFNALLALRANSGDDLLLDHIRNGPKNAQYTSGDIQNEMINLCRVNIQVRKTLFIELHEFQRNLSDHRKE